MTVMRFAAVLPDVLPQTYLVTAGVFPGGFAGHPGVGCAGAASGWFHGVEWGNLWKPGFRLACSLGVVQQCCGQHSSGMRSPQYTDVFSAIGMQVMDALPNNEFVNVVIVFLGSPAYIKNAHLRAKLIDVRPWSWPSQSVQ